MTRRPRFGGTPPHGRVDYRRIGRFANRSHQCQMFSHTAAYEVIRQCPLFAFLSDALSSRFTHPWTVKANAYKLLSRLTNVAIS